MRKFTLLKTLVERLMFNEQKEVLNLNDLIKWSL